jgi:hypothetical protein
MSLQFHHEVDWTLRGIQMRRLTSKTEVAT